MPNLDDVIQEIKAHTSDPVHGGSPYAYRFYRPSAFAGDSRINGMESAALIEVRVLHDGTFNITAMDRAGRPVHVRKPPPETDDSPIGPTRSGR